jgi:hypothetical protein
MRLSSYSYRTLVNFFHYMLAIDGRFARKAVFQIIQNKVFFVPRGMENRQGLPSITPGHRK